MSAERTRREDPRIGRAVAELQATIRAKYPAATFEVGRGDDPDGTYVWATVDVEDTDEVIDLVIDRLLELQVEERLPVYLIPVRPPERVAALYHRAKTELPRALLD